MNDSFSNYQSGRNSGGQDPMTGQKRSEKKKQNLVLPILLIAVGCVVFIFAAWSAVTSPVFASILSGSPETEQRNTGPSFAQVNIAKPTYTPVGSVSVAQVIIPTATMTQLIEQQVVVVQPTNIPLTAILDIPTATAEVAIAQVNPPSEGVAYAEIVVDTPTSEYIAPTAVAYVPPVSSPGNGVHWFDVDLSDQRMYAYEGDTLVKIGRAHV